MTFPVTFALLMVTCMTWYRDLIKGNEVNREIRTTFLPSVPEVHAKKPYCKIRCGVISQRRGETDLRHVVSETWKKLKATRNLSSIEVSFDENEPRHDLSMDSMIKAYIAIGTTNVSAIIGPFVSTVLTATLKFGIPYFLTENTVRHQGNDQELGSRSHYRYSYLDEKPYNLISTRPRLQDLSELARDFIAFFNWSTVAVLYAGRSGAELVEKLVQIPKLHVTSWIIPLTSDSRRQSTSPQARPTPSSDDDDFVGVNDFIGDSGNGDWRDDMVVSASKLRKILLEVRGASFSSIILVDPDGDLPLEVIFNEALKLSMFTSRYEWIYLSFDQPSFDESTYHFSGVVLVATHLSHNGAGKMFKDFNWRHFSNLEVSTIVDSLLTIYQALVINHRETGNCSMAGEKRLEELLEKVSLETFSGQLRFNRDGSRTGYVIEIHALVPGGLKQIGLWNSSIPLHESGRLRIDRTLLHLRSDASGATNDATGSAAGVGQGQDGATSPGKGAGALDKSKKRHFTVALPREFPFVMLRPDHWNRTEMDRYHGYCLDFLRELSRDLSFNYDVTVVSDDVINYCCGSSKGGGGLLATIQNGSASFGLPFPVSSATNKMLDLTIPFSSTEWAVLITGADQGHSHRFSSLQVWLFIFIEPFPPLIWLVLVGAVLVASCCLYVLESMDLLRPLEERMLVTQDVWSGGCIGCHDTNPEVVPTIIQGEGEFGKCQGFVSDSDLTERPSIDYSFDDRFGTRACCCCCDCKKSTASHAVVSLPGEVGTTVAVDSRMSSGGKYVSLSFVQCLWIVITMTTLRDLNSPIRLLHRTAVGRVFSLLLRSFSLVTIISYASSLVLLLSKLELQTSRPHRDSFLSTVDQIFTRNTGSKVFLPSKEVENYLFDQEDMEMDAYVRADATLESTNLAWRRLLASDRISYLKEIIQTQHSSEYNSSTPQQSSFLENLFSPGRPAKLKSPINHSTKPIRDQPTITVWHLAGLNHISSKLCLEAADVGEGLKVIVKPLMERKQHKQRIHFSIALPQGTSLRNELNAGILRLKEQGILERLERRWELWTAPCSMVNPKDKSDSFIGNANLQMFGGFSAVFCCLWVSNVFWAIFRRKRKRCNSFYRTEKRVRSVKNENHHPHHTSLRLSSHEQSLPQADTRDVPGSSPPTFDQSMSFNIVSESTALTAIPSTDLTLATASTMPELQESSTSQGLHQRHHHHHHPHHHHHRHKQHTRRRDRAGGTTSSMQKPKADSYPTWRRQTNIF